MVNIFWFRRDLRLHDNVGLFHALNGEHPVVPVFIFDEDILQELRTKPPSADRRLQFIHMALQRMNESLQELGSTMKIYVGKPAEVWPKILSEFEVASVFTNRDYEPYAIRRDNAVRELLEKQKVAFNTYKDQVIFETDEVVKDDGEPYVVFTPYSRKWKAALDDASFKAVPSKSVEGAWAALKWTELPTLESIGFASMEPDWPTPDIEPDFLADYGKTRDFPAKDGTSRIGPHLRFGTCSIRQIARRARQAGADTYLNELIWREFYMMILWHFPHVVDRAFRPDYDNIPWRNDRGEFEKWCEGKTGYPLVDAGMRELKATGYMHNRVRMVTASFLTKHLLIDWRWGEAWFARHLLDYELASNNGGWQWAAGTGCDAAPYFRIFNPESQWKKFDKETAYVQHWVPEWSSDEYPDPMVDHRSARQRALDVYKKALDEART